MTIYAAQIIRDRVLGTLFPDSIVITDGHERKKERNGYFPMSTISFNAFLKQAIVTCNQWFLNSVQTCYTELS
jgi:hypothetical protein